MFVPLIINGHGMDQQKIRILVLTKKFSVCKKVGIRIAVIPVVNSGIDGLRRLKLYSVMLYAEWNMVIELSEPVVCGGGGFSSMLFAERKHIVAVQGF